MDRLHCSYEEYLRLPLRVVDDALIVMEAEAKVAETERDGRRS